MMYALVISLLLLQAAPDSLPAVQKSADRTLPVRAVEEGSAALFLLGPDATFTQAGVSWNGRSESAPLYREEGKGLQEGQVNIRTLVRLDSTQAVRGTVRYTNGVKREVNWNSSSDFFTVYPYVVADTVGGNVNKEEYAFSGGYAARYGAFHWGAEAAYRALHEYRMVDPRPRNIVSDLQVKASAGWRVLSTYVVEATVGYRRYSQTQSMVFISERGKNSSVFHFTGLGSDFARFTGATDSYMNTRYAGNGLLFGLAWSPLGAAGWEASVDYRHLDITHYLPNLNQVPYTELYTRTLQAQGGYLSRSAAWSWKAGAHLQYQWRQGLESILDSGASGYLKELGRLLMFSSETLTAGVHGAVDYRQQWSLQGRAEYRSFSALYAYPARSLAYGGLDVQLEAIYRWHRGHWFVSPALQAGMYQHLIGSMHIPSTYTEPLFMTYYQDFFARAKAACWRGGLSVHAERQLTRLLSLYAQASFQALSPQGYGPGFLHTLTVGINF